MAYIVTRNNRYYVVSYDGIDPSTGRERRRWQLRKISPCQCRSDRRITHPAARCIGDPAGPRRRHPVLLPPDRWATRNADARVVPQPPTATAGSSSTTSTRLRATSCCALLALSTSTTCTHHRWHIGGRNGDGLAPKTVHEVHVIIRSALNDAIDCGLLRNNAAAEGPIATTRRPSTNRNISVGCHTTRRVPRDRQPPSSLL